MIANPEVNDQVHLKLRIHDATRGWATQKTAAA
jgi:hypothetical protein